MVSSGAPAWEQRWHPLREEWVVVAAHRQDRPWQGERAHGLATRGARIRRELLFLSAATCAWAARGTRTTSRCSSSTTTIPASALDAPRQLEPPPGIYRNAPATGIARVVCYTPKHNIDARGAAG